ncbi:uncharacterized protein FIBRA_06380 [Fibroporia radiculosa]|uniref:Cytochrome c oxidase assembly factor 6 n=1 Tax=Fibroporia radiculosa TaxID=599839 RepID=J4GBB4_9APHY|nr:uncharacterized protein FIBRA_06380 [Fibroporia radiculosa]CCM04213.1 predicted protein [Fibroporia radiculosa]
MIHGDPRDWPAGHFRLWRVRGLPEFVRTFRATTFELVGQMGLFGTKAPEKPDPVSRSDRQKCWDSRDAYFACLDEKGIVKAGDEGNACASQVAAYEKNCAKSWIDYFNKRRVLAEQQQGVLTQAKIQANAAGRP